ncbi:MAG: ABC transporter ATP-binding protein/permease [Clostridiales bacterium]|nr:ABC transporter ATP-binding protein/permease [Clostridiales bacterium]
MKQAKKQSTMRGVLKYLKPYTGYLLCTILLALVTVALTLAVPYLVGLAIDCIIGKSNVDYDRLYKIFLAIGVCVAATPICQWLMSVCNNKIAYGMLCDVRRDAFDKLHVLPLSYLDSRAYGETASVVISDAEQFSDGLLLGFTQLFTGFATILGVLVIMFLLSWKIALVVFCITPLSLFCSKFIASRTYKMFRVQSETRADQTAFIDEMIGNLKVVKAYTHEDENEEIFGEKNEKLRKCSLRAIFFSSTTNPVTRFVNSVVYAAVALVGAFTVISTGGAFTVGNLSSLLSYSNQYTKPFNEISEVVTEFQNALACAARLFALIGAKEQPSDENCEELEKVSGEVALDHVSFSYDKSKKLLEDISLNVKAGQRIAIVGPTGCGKTTLINLLMRFYDADGGAVKVEGKDIREVTRKSLRKHLGMVLQDTWLKEGTVRENLCMGKPDATDEEMIAAAKAAHAHSFIRRLPNGYDTVLSGAGALSEGQKQLLCIARLMLCHPPMLILDEATSNIDTRTEKKVQDAFSALMAGRTCFIVAHRLSTIENADRILVMNAGNVIEQGTHTELMQKGGFYSNLYKAQFALPE